MTGFKLARTPEILFGAGRFRELPGLVRRYGKTALVVTGAASFASSGRRAALHGLLREGAIDFAEEAVAGEPTPELVDGVVARHRVPGPTVVLAIGGGSVIDAGKAVAAMLTVEDGVVNYLEGVGDREHPGSKVPFIAVPTTAGTGSEATKNAVLSRSGPAGFKKSLRHDNFVPDIALVDPELTAGTPPEISAACGMDAFTQLLESFVSTKATPPTDALAASGMAAMAPNMTAACLEDAAEARAALAYGALLSGITLANAGLGVVHGLAGAVGGLFPVPHGIACGTLLAEATARTIALLRASGPEGKPGLEKYAAAGRLFAGQGSADMASGCGLLVEKLFAWNEALAMPRLGKYGITEQDVPAIVAVADNKNNPAVFDAAGLAALLRSRL